MSLATATFEGSIIGGVEIVTDSTTARTPTVTDRGKFINCTNAASIVITLNDSVFSAGDTISFSHKTAGMTISFAGSAASEQDLLTNYTHVTVVFTTGGASSTYRVIGS